MTNRKRSAAAKKGWATRRKNQVKKDIGRTAIWVVPGVNTAINIGKTLKDASKVLTPKGQAVAEQPKKADVIARGIAPENGIFSNEKILLMNLKDHEKSDFSSIKEKYGYSAIDKLKNLGLIEHGIDSKLYSQKSFVNILEKGKKVAKHLQEVEGLMEAE